MKKKVKKSTPRTHKIGFTHLHWTIIFLSVAVFVLGFAYLHASTQSDANERENSFQWHKEVGKKACEAKGQPIIAVEQRILNDADSGEAGNYWAYDTIERQIKVWKTSSTTFCATVGYEGKFAAIAGQKSPGNTGILTGKERGEFAGGYIASISGTLLTTPSLPQHGSIGTTDYQCDVNGNCPGAFDWTTKYFNTSAPGFTFNMPWWGWIYHNGKHVWINAITGNSGDVI